MGRRVHVEQNTKNTTQNKRGTEPQPEFRFSFSFKNRPAYHYIVFVHRPQQSFDWRLLTLKWSSLSARAVYTASRTSVGPDLHCRTSLHCTDGHASLSSRLVIISLSADGLYLWYGHHCWLRSYGFAGSTWSPWYQSSLWGRLSGYAVLLTAGRQPLIGTPSLLVSLH